MSFTYTFSKLTKMGEPDPKYGQAYWGEVNEDIKPVKFNSMNPDITGNDTIECEERSEKQSSKGTIYYQLKKVRVVSVDEDFNRANNPATASQYQMSNAQTQLDRIEAKLDQLLGAQAKAVSDQDDINLNDIPF